MVRYNKINKNFPKEKGIMGKNNKKRILSVLLVIALVGTFAFTGCGKKKSESSSAESSSAESSVTESSSAESSSAESSAESSSSDKGDAGSIVKGNDLSYDGYTEVWKDEFDGNTLNRADWNVELHDPGWVNAELQAYIDSEENIYVKDGKLYLNPVHTKNEAGEDVYTSGRVNTQGKHDFKYGLFEATLKVPSGMGYLPAFWMMPTDENLYGQWPKCGEIDIMEVMGQSTNTLHGTIHYGEPHAQQQGTYELSEGPSFSEEFHTFSFEWEPDHMTWYVDGVKYFETTDWFTAVEGGGEITYPAPYDQPFYVILNLAIGGSWVGYPDETTSFDNNPYIIDSVKVYQKDASYYAEKEAKAEKPVKVVNFRDPDENGNYVNNANFATDINKDTDWELHLETDGSGSTTKVENNTIVITPSAVGGVPYSVQLKQQGIPICEGVEYTLTFDAKADENRTIIIDIEGPSRNWKRYFGDTTLDITTEMKTYTFTFTMTDETDADTSLEFNLGQQGSTAAVTLANISLKATGGTKIESGNKAKKVRADGNYVYNGKFQEGTRRLGYWEMEDDVKSMVSVTNENNIRILKVVAPEGTSADKPVVIKQTGLPLIAGEYALSYKVYKENAADNDNSFKIVVGKFTADQDIDSNSTSEYSTKFTFAEGDAAEIALYFMAPGTYYVDDIMVGENAMIKNGSFNAGMSGFVEYTYNTAKSTYTVDSLSEDNAFAVTINDTGTEDWHVQLYQDGVNLEKGKFYRLTFKAKSTLPRNIKCTIQHNGSNDDIWDPYFDHIIADLDKDYKTFTVDFEMQAESDPVSRLYFALGKVDEQITEGHSICIDDITLVEIDKSEAKIPEKE